MLLLFIYDTLFFSAASNVDFKSATTFYFTCHFTDKETLVGRLKEIAQGCTAGR